MLNGYVKWDGFDPEQKEKVFEAVIDGKQSREWLDGIKSDDRFRTEDFVHETITPERQQALAAEIRQDEYAARVRDYGPEDAATYEQRVQDGADSVHHLELETKAINRGEIERVVNEMESGWPTPAPAGLTPASRGFGDPATFPSWSDLNSSNSLAADSPTHSTDKEYKGPER